MELAFPYARYACPCTEITSTVPSSISTKHSSQDVHSEADDDGATFNPHHPRAPFSLYPIEHLLYCDDCHQIRCPRCTTEELMYWLCPSCLFEVPSSSVKSDGNRCTRHCYDCPLCSANLSVTAVNRHADTPHLKPGSDTSSESYILHCQYCDWSSLEIDVSFTKPTKITEQLNKLWKLKHPHSVEKESEDIKEQEHGARLHHDTAFANLHKFYKEQFSDSGDQPNAYSNSPYSSPANLARIMSLYGGLSLNSLKKAKEKPQPMREADGKIEGLQAFTIDDVDEDDEIIGRMRQSGINGIATQQQRLMAPSNYDSRFTQDLWPVATRLLVRRGKRCRGCRQFLARPDQKLDRLKYKIRLLASSFIQRLSIRPLNSFPLTQNHAFRLRADPIEQVRLQPHQAQQYILTIHNPIFEPVRVTLSTPTTTPGKVASRVTILCPSFTVGQNGDRWDEALSNSSISTSTNDDGSRRAAMASLTGSSESDRQPEAGKIWSRHWNTTSVIVEVVPGPIVAPDNNVFVPDSGSAAESTQEEDVVELPIYVRVEWEGAMHDHANAITTKSEPDRKEHRELAYWCVLGLGRIT